MHHVHGPHSWMMDYFFIRPDGSIEDVNEDEVTTTTYRGRPMMIILCFIHCNTRYVQAFAVPNKAQETFQMHLQHMKWRVDKEMDVLISDYERAFCAEGVLRWCRNNGIKRIYFNMSDTATYKTSHLALAPIDRFAKTLRDMIFNARRTGTFVLTNDTLAQLVYIYNNTPHATLSGLMKFNVTPTEAFMHRELQDEIVRRTFSQNYFTATEPSAYDFVNVGDKVYLHKPQVFGEKRRLNVEEVPYVVRDVKLGGFDLGTSEEFFVDGGRSSRSRIVPRSEVVIKKQT